ncbi:MAG: hypothetical protein LBV41_11510 [Cytophagaceae bacterium]|jgi:hypothetical protein|nr:hypothetical protein [Cytophagaceae bacterium]
MNKIQLLYFLSVTLFWSCGGEISREELAKNRLMEIEKMADAGNYNLAKLKLDTLIQSFGDQTEYVLSAKNMLKQLNVIEQERNLAYLDSMLKAQEALLAPMMNNFTVSDEYGSDKILIHKRQKPENSFNRTYIRAFLNQAGKFYISSRYHGNKWIYHQQIKVYNKEEFVLSEVVEEDGFNNRRFDDQDLKWEVVNYKDGKDNGIVDYIATHWKELLKVQFIGKGNAYIVMEQFDKEAVRDGYEISFVLKEIQRIKEEQRKVQKTLENMK